MDRIRNISVSDQQTRAEAYRPSLPSDGYPGFDASDLQKRSLHHLKRMNADPGIGYPSYLRALGSVPRHQREQCIRQIGFTCEDRISYNYNGSSPAKALRALSSVRPLTFDCGSAIHFAIHVALLDQLGDHGYDRYIREECGGELSIDAVQRPSLYERFLLFRNHLGQGTPSEDIQSGDALYFEASKDAPWVHPASEDNAYNVLADVEGPGEARFVGFVSEATPTLGTWTCKDLMDFLVEKRKENLTLGDLSIIERNVGSTSGQASSESSPIFAQVHETLRSQSTAYEAARLALEAGNYDPLQRTDLEPPPLKSIVGLVEHTRIVDMP